jgi:chromosome segregation ATPase
MNTPLPLTMTELLILIAGAIMLGITIHFFIVSRRSLNASSPQTQQKINKELEERKLRYLNDIEWKEKEVNELKHRIEKLEEDNEILAIEAEEMREKNKKLVNAAAPPVVKEQVAEERSRYAEQLRETQAELRAYNEKINQMLGDLNLMGEMEERQGSLEKENRDLRQENEELVQQLERSQQVLNSLQQKKEITAEMSSMIDNAYSEFGLLQEKISKLEGQVSGSQKLNMDYIDAQDELNKLTRLLEEEKRKYNTIYAEKREMEEEYRETEEKLREANFQRQQMQKRIAYLEELNLDLQSVTEINNNLQAQIRRIGELESRLQLLSQEKEELLKKKNP